MPPKKTLEEMIEELPFEMTIDGRNRLYSFDLSFYPSFGWQAKLEPLGKDLPDISTSSDLETPTEAVQSLHARMVEMGIIK
jgi:hypothetical protein